MAAPKKNLKVSLLASESYLTSTKYLRLLGYIISAAFFVDFLASWWNGLLDISLLPQLGLLAGIPLGYCVWKQQESKRQVKAFMQAELSEYRAKIGTQDVKPGEIIFLRRSDSALLTLNTAMEKNGS